MSDSVCKLNWQKSAFIKSPDCSTILIEGYYRQCLVYAKRHPTTQPAPPPHTHTQTPTYTHKREQFCYYAIYAHLRCHNI